MSRDVDDFLRRAHRLMLHIHGASEEQDEQWEQKAKEWRDEYLVRYDPGRGLGVNQAMGTHHEVKLVESDNETDPARVVCSCGWYMECTRFGVQVGEIGGLPWVMKRYAEHLQSPSEEEPVTTILPSGDPPTTGDSRTYRAQDEEPTHDVSVDPTPGSVRPRICPKCGHHVVKHDHGGSCHGKDDQTGECMCINAEYADDRFENPNGRLNPPTLTKNRLLDEAATLLALWFTGNATTTTVRQTDAFFENIEVDAYAVGEAVGLTGHVPSAHGTPAVPSAPTDGAKLSGGPGTVTKAGTFYRRNPLGPPREEADGHGWADNAHGGLTCWYCGESGVANRQDPCPVTAPLAHHTEGSDS